MRAREHISYVHSIVKMKTETNERTQEREKKNETHYDEIAVKYTNGFSYVRGFC